MTNRPAGNNAEKDQALFNSIAHSYFQKDLHPAHRLARKLRLEQTIGNVDHINMPSILEVGCGGGFAAEYLAGKYSYYLGLDYSAELISFAEKQHQIPAANFTVADIATFDTEIRFDVILMVGLLHHLEDPSGILSSITRFLKPGGKIYANEPQNGNPVISFARWIRKKIDSSYSEDQLEYSRKDLIEMSKRAGLDQITVRPQGLLSTPFAEVSLPLQWLMTPISKACCVVDHFLEKNISTLLMYLSWNLVLEAKVKPRKEIK